MGNATPRHAFHALHVSGVGERVGKDLHEFVSSRRWRYGEGWQTGQNEQLGVREGEIWSGDVGVFVFSCMAVLFIP